jgi:hypothetical protein
VDEAVYANLVELVNTVGGNRVKRKLDQSPDTIFNQAEDGLPWDPAEEKDSQCR